jgi:hypothetical protein
MRKPETFVRTGAFEVTRYDLLGKKYPLSSTEEIKKYFDIFFDGDYLLPFRAQASHCSRQPSTLLEGPGRSVA